MHTTPHPIRPRGRFAPSPTGSLHFGSILTAVASYLNVKKQNGMWLVRIEDIDIQRVVPKAADGILTTLDNLGLYWDEPPVYQSQRLEYYAHAIEQLNQHNLTYRCDCTRKAIRALGGIYPGICRHKTWQKSPERHAIRLHNQHPISMFTDILMGTQYVETQLAHEDFILKRSDGQFAYNFVSVVDDIAFKITEVIRGADMLTTTSRQISLYKTLQLPQPAWMHIPLALNANGHKLAKQNQAPAVDNYPATEVLSAALTFLGHPPPVDLQQVGCEDMLSYALIKWDPQQINRSNRVCAYG